MKYQEIEGDLIELALAGSFDVIAHGCNCYNIQGKGIALQMKRVFSTDLYEKEDPQYLRDINKLGQIQYVFRKTYVNGKLVAVVNAYTQFGPGPNLDYNALTLCLRKINHKFKGKHIGLPLIGCGIAGGIWDLDAYSLKESESFRIATQLRSNGFKDVKTIIQEELKDCDVTIVHYKK